jgi:hypothetical protein
VDGSSTNQGSLTDQFKKIAARPRSMISVITELPFLNSMPPTAGRSANASGAECHAEDSCSAGSVSASLEALGRSRSSVDDWNDLLASLRE